MTDVTSVVQAPRRGRPPKIRQAEAPAPTPAPAAALPPIQVRPPAAVAAPPRFPPLAAPLPPMQQQPPQPQNHVWYRLQGRWYPISPQRAHAKGWAFQEEEPGPDEVRCEDWQQRIDALDVQALRHQA